MANLMVCTANAAIRRKARMACLARPIGDARGTNVPGAPWWVAGA
jgi:hypothetical protein